MTGGRTRLRWRWWPLAGFALAVALFASALVRQTADAPAADHVASAWTGRTPPAFRLPVLAGPAGPGDTAPADAGTPAPADPTPATLGTADLRGRAFLLHVWATWCASCVEAHARWRRIADEAPIPVVGLLHRDRAEAGRAWVARHGTGATWLLLDAQGDAGHDWGVQGVPETFVVDAEGVVRLHVAGPLTEARWRDEVAPLVARLAATDDAGGPRTADASRGGR